MKKTLVALTIVAVLGFAAMAMAHGPGGGYGGHMGYGYGGGMMGNGYGGGHMDYGYANDTETKAFLEKTADLRRELNTKRFDYEEAVRAGDEKKAEKLARELDELSAKLYKEAPASYGRGCR